MSNTALWDIVQKTDPKHVKAITGKSYQGTSPKPHYLIHKATETFGPCGIGWGFTIVDERIEEGAGGERMSIARVRVWYEWPNRKGEYVRGEVEHIGGTSFSGMRSSGKPFTDEDAPKKSVTDALVKALSMIGFAGDIFMGRYDDSKYVQELNEEARQSSTPKPTEQPKPIERMAEDNPKATELKKRLNDKLLTFKTAKDVDTFWAQKTVGDALKSLPEKWEFDLIDAKIGFVNDLQKDSRSVPNFDNLDTGYGPGDYAE